MRADISPKYKVMRLIYVHVKGTELRYITPYSAWYHTMGHVGGALTYVEPEPAPLAEMVLLQGYELCGPIGVL
jgi:hypothetical protein